MTASTSEDLLQSGDVVKDRWKVVSRFYIPVLFQDSRYFTECIRDGAWCKFTFYTFCLLYFYL